MAHSKVHKMDQNILEPMSMINVKAMEHTLGQTVTNSKASGKTMMKSRASSHRRMGQNMLGSSKTDKRMGLVPLSTLMEMCMKETGSKVERQDKADSLMQMEMNTLVVGRMVKEMAAVFSHGLMAQNMKVISRMVKEMVMEFIHGLMAQSMKVIGRMVKEMVMEFTQSLMAQSMKVIGRKE